MKKIIFFMALLFSAAIYGMDVNNKPSSVKKFSIIEIFKKWNGDKMMYPSPHWIGPWYSRPGAKILIQKEQEELEKSLKFLSAKVVLKNWPTVDEIKELSIKLPTELYEYLEETKKMLN